MSQRARTAVALAALAVLTLSAGGDENTATPTYEVAEVKRRLVREQPEPEERLDAGARPIAGDLLRTGSRSSAEIVCPDYGARFRLASKTRARLAPGRPGVLLEVERGSLRAIFGKFLGEDPPERIVTTPSAVLAVRGTDYGVEVGKSGDTTVTVFSGEVEVVDIDRSMPSIRVRAGEYSTIRRGKTPGTPRPHEINQKDWDGGRRPENARRGGAERDPMQGGGVEDMGSQGSGRGSQGSGMGGSSGGSSGGSRRPQGGGSGGGRD